MAMDERTGPPDRQEADKPGRVLISELPGSVKVSLVGVFLLLLMGALFFARDFLVPVSLAFLFALALGPVVRRLERQGVPAPLTAAAAVALLFTLTAVGMYSLSGPVQHWLDSAPQIGAQLQRKMRVLLKPVEAVREASEQVDVIAKGGAEPGVQRVVVQEPGLLSRAAAGVPDVAAQIGLMLVLLLFLLASGDLFYEKLVRALPTLSDKKRALRIARDIEYEVSRFLLTITMINIGFGLWIGLGLYLIGMPNPALWGVAAFLLNFIPFIGAVIGTILVGVVAFVSFDSLLYALLPPALYIFTTTVEGHFLTPMIVGRRLELNTVVVFLSVAFWGWLWGIIGALIAVPILVVVKVFTDHVEGLGGLGEFLSERTSGIGDEEEPQPEAAAGPVATGVSVRPPHSAHEPS